MRVCFVCLGNICRSPTAEGIFRKLLADEGLADQVEVDSAGTGDWHIGEPPDRRAQAEAARRGLDLAALRGRQFQPHDFARFDLIVAMDHQNLEDLRRLAPDDEQRAKVWLLRSFDPNADDPEVPDPWFGGPEGFRSVYDTIEAACRHLLEEVTARL